MLTNTKFYFFTEDLNENVINNIAKFKNIAVIYKNTKSTNINDSNIIVLKKFCKKNKILFIISDNYKLAIKYKADGFFISNSNKKTFLFEGIKKNFIIIGSAHNRLEYHLKIRQGCKSIMLSPLFYNKKYSVNKILGISKFNIISNEWKSEICALGGINLKNLNKVKLTSANSVGFVSLINDPKIKKPVYFKSRQAF